MSPTLAFTVIPKAPHFLDKILTVYCYDLGDLLCLTMHSKP